jgi:hypothetical protein
VKLDYGASSSVEYKAAVPLTGELPDGIGTSDHEELGKQFIEGI